MTPLKQPQNTITNPAHTLPTGEEYQKDIGNPRASNKIIEDGNINNAGQISVPLLSRSIEDESPIHQSDNIPTATPILDLRLTKPRLAQRERTLQPLAPSKIKSSGLAMQSSSDEIYRSSPRSDTGFDEKNCMSEDDKEESSRSEIKSILEQFSEDGHGPGHEEVMSPRLEAAGSLVGGSAQHPPRKSSLEPLKASSLEIQEMKNLKALATKQLSDLANVRQSLSIKPMLTSNLIQTNSTENKSTSLEASGSSSLHRPPPLESESEPNLPFDFHRFLEQLRHKTADPVAKFLRSFLQEFGKRQWMVHEQVKIISDFLAFISKKMEYCEIWSEVSDAEFDNAREGMEKLVMNRLYTQTFSPDIPPPQPIAGSKSRRKGIDRPMGPGRRGQHQEDVERDEILAQKVSIYGWIKERHLDIPPVVDAGRNFLILAQKEILKIKTYRAPRDKIICVLNCCKANPEHLVSNIQYILRFRNQEKLVGEAGYYLASLLGAVQFIENLDRTTLTISDEEFEQNVEAAVSAIAEKHQAQVHDEIQPKTESAPRYDESVSCDLNEAEYAVAKKPTFSNDGDSGDTSDDKAPIGSLLRTIQRPLSSFGWIFSEESSTSQNSLVKAPQSESTPRPKIPSEVTTDRSEILNCAKEVDNTKISQIDDVPERQNASLALKARQNQRMEFSTVVDTLCGMFPDLDREIIKDVVTEKEGRVTLAVDACLVLSQVNE